MNDDRYTPIATPLALLATLALSACGGGSATGGSTTMPPPPVAPPTVDCSRGMTACPELSIAGDAASSTPTFSGFADPSLRADPAVQNQIWLVYSYLEGKPATSAAGTAVGVPVVSTHLARSIDGGVSWTWDSRLWASELVADPEALGPSSYYGSETPSLAVQSAAGQTTWYSVRLSYFLEPKSAYAPRFGSSWTMRVAAAPSPAALATAPEAILGTATTSAAYKVNVRMTSLSPLLSECAFWNNPAVAWLNSRLYLIAECIELDGTMVSATRSRIVVFATDAAGAAASWTWEYLGVLADHSTALELGGQRLVSADVSHSRDGSLIVVTTVLGGSSGDLGLGCQALELLSLNPPALRRSDAGALIARAVETAAADATWHSGACTYDAASASGMLTVAASTTPTSLNAELRATGLRP